VEILRKYIFRILKTVSFYIIKSIYRGNILNTRKTFF